MKIGNIDFTAIGWEKFISLPKEKQLEKVYNSLSPKDYKEAERLLKDVPNSGSINNIETVTDGNITTGDEQETALNNGSDIAGGYVGDNTPGRGKHPEKRKDKRA